MDALVLADPYAALRDGPFLESVSRIVHHWVHRFGVPERDREDVRQNVLLAVLRGLPAFNPARSLWPWLKTITYRVTRDYRQLAQHWRERLEGDADERMADGSPDAEATLISAEMGRTVRDLLETIDPARREILIRHDRDGAPMAELAASQGISVNTAYTRLRLARADFRAAWARRTR